MHIHICVSQSFSFPVYVHVLQLDLLYIKINIFENNTEFDEWYCS